MKTLITSTYDIEGGAARAAYRLHQGLQNAGIDSKLLAQHKSSEDYHVSAPSTRLTQSLANSRITVDLLPTKLYTQRKSRGFSVQWLPESIATKVKNINPDIVNIHWINQGFMRIETLAKINKPLVWTLHDMWAFTGGCYYSGDCHSYKFSCGNCPQLNSKQDLDLSRWIWWRKAKSWKNLNLTIVTPSNWLAECARASSLFKDFRIEVIPNGIDLSLYRPIDKKTARELLGLPVDKTLVLFGSLAATRDQRKGYHLLRSAIEKLDTPQWQDKLELVVFGASKPNNTSADELNFPINYLGKLNDDLSLVLAYSAADVFVLPSLQDNLPNTGIESLACGTPCVGFDVGGIKDFIDRHKNGYLATPYEVDDLARGINWILEDKQRYSQISSSGRSKIENSFTNTIQAEKYQALFQDILSEQKKSL